MGVTSSSSKQPLPKDHPFNLGIEEKDYSTLLQTSCDPKYPVKFLEGLLSVGVSANLFNDYDGKDFPILDAARNNNLKAINLLLKNGANINSVAYYSGRSALHICANQNFLEMANVLLDHEDVDVDIKDNKGQQTPLYIAVKKKNVRIATKLIEHGADLNYKVFGKTILERIRDKIPQFDPLSVEVIVPKKALTDRQIKFHKLVGLIENTSSIWLEDEPGRKETYLKEFKLTLLTLDRENGDFYGHANNSLLYKTCVESLPDFAEALLIGGFAQPNEMSQMSEMTPLSMAAHRANLKLIQILLQYGANIETAITKGMRETILHILLGQQILQPIENITKCLMYLLDPPT